VPSKPGEQVRVQADKPLLSVLRGEQRSPPPVWMMRQAGRYLPEYRLLREQKGGFLDLVYDSDAAAEITLQPLKRFPELDAAILFSDILIVPFAIGQNLSFVAGEGPRLTPPLIASRLEDLTAYEGRLEPIYATVAKVKAELDPGKTLLGFAGSPWTVATYMVAGQGSREQGEARRFAYTDPGAFGAIITRIEEITLNYLSGQIAAGADAVQLFDSWAGSLSPSQFEQWVIAPTARIVAALHERHPKVPIIGFPKGAGGKLAPYDLEPGVTALGLAATLDPVWAAMSAPARLPVQGNLDPLALIAGGETMRSAVERILDAFAGRPHIFNLGHGILQDSPIAHVQDMLAAVKGGI
jgi:uroporphyrinogen decarboxylase